MYSTKQNVLQLTSLLLQSGINHIVVCPGSRNIPLVHTFVAAGIQCYEITDERSAGFFALGLIQALEGRPVAVCCTSGSAVLNLAPAVSEAYYHPLPLLIITADRPLRWIGQMDGQTMNQPEAFISCIRKTVTIPEISEGEERWHTNRLINEALLTIKQTSGPVHINVPISEPMFDFTAPQLPTERLISLHANTSAPFRLSDELAQQWKESTRRIILVGQMMPYEAAALSPYLQALHEDGCVILAENLSNLQTTSCHANIIYNFDEILNSSSFQIPQPEIVITIGGHIVSKRLKQYLRSGNSSHTTNHWIINPLGELTDLFQCATELIQTSPLTALAALAALHSHQTDYQTQWHIYSKQIEMRKQFVGKYSDLQALQTLLPAITDQWTVHVANSSTVRNVNLLHKLNTPVYCNRGINGIEGCISSAIGHWVGSHTKTLIITGDLSFFYDQNALWNQFVKHPASPLRIIILNNGCGQIFHHLPGLTTPSLDRYIAASHTTTAEGISHTCGAQYIPVHDLQTLKNCISTFFSSVPDIRIMEIFTDPSTNEQVHKEFLQMCFI